MNTKTNHKNGGKNEVEKGGARQNKEVERKRKLDKRLKDQRFWKREKAIMDAFFQAHGRVSVKDLAGEAGVARTTFYRHHKGVCEVMPDLEKRILAEYEGEIRDFKLGKKMKIRFLYYRMLVFIHRHRREFEMIVERGDERTLEEMVVELMPRVTTEYRIPAAYDEVLRIYEKEVTAVVETWIMDDFSTSEKGVLNDIMYLTKSARQRLLQIGR